MTDISQKRGPGRPRKEEAPAAPDAKPHATSVQSDMVTVEITSEAHAFDSSGRKYLFGSAPTVDRSIADDWVSAGRAIIL